MIIPLLIAVVLVISTVGLALSIMESVKLHKEMNRHGERLNELNQSYHETSEHLEQ